jgi:hypothetical protein
VPTERSSPISTSSDSTSSSDSAAGNMSRSHTFRRPARFGAKKPSLAHVDDEEDDEEDEPTFLGSTDNKKPSITPNAHRGQDITVTVRDNRFGQPSSSATKSASHVTAKESVELNSKGKARVPSTTADSSTGSLSSPGSNKPNNRTQQQHRGLGALSPRHRAELRGVGSPRRGTSGTQGESDETPSMGSSFSDLDGKRLFQCYRDA